MKIFILPIQVFFISLILNSCGTGDSNVSDEVDETPLSIIPQEEDKNVKTEVEYVIEFQDGNIQKLSEKIYRDGSIWTSFKVNNEIIFEKKYELPTTYPEELLKLKGMIDYHDSFVNDEATAKEFNNKYKVLNFHKSISSISDLDMSPEEKKRLQRELKEKWLKDRKQKFKEQQSK